MKAKGHRAFTKRRRQSQADMGFLILGVAFENDNSNAPIPHTTAASLAGG
jgi:hypothetical protein